MTWNPDEKEQQIRADERKKTEQEIADWLSFPLTNELGIKFWADSTIRLVELLVEKIRTGKYMKEGS